MRSLRFRLPALFVVAVVAAGLVTALIAVQLFQDYTHDDTLSDLRRQASGLAELYKGQAVTASDEGLSAPAFAAENLERATDARLYIVGLEIFPGQISGLRELELGQLGWDEIPDRVREFEFEPPGTGRTFLAVAHPIAFGNDYTFAALVVAKPQAELRSRWTVLVERLLLAFLGGLVVAAGLAWYLSRRLTEPVLALSRAADQVAEGRYDAELPEPRSRDEVGHLTERFQEMTARLGESEERERNFLMSVSHELKTPLTAIRGHVDAMREGLTEDPEARAASLEAIRSATDRLARLVGDLLELAKLDAHRFTLVEEEVDVRRLLEQAYEGFGERARQRGIEYRRRFEASPVIETDGDRVLQIVSNLLENAFTWTPDGGTVSLELTGDSGTLAVAVSDSGPGVPAEERERIFRPFVSRDGSGSGLGLTIARELAHALGGELRLASSGREGSRFELRLPARETRYAEPAPVR